MNGGLLVLGAVGALAAAGAGLTRLAGSPNRPRRPLSQQGPDHRVQGSVYDDPFDAFDDVIRPFLEEKVYAFFDIDEDEEDDPDAAYEASARQDLSDWGLGPNDPTFAWSTLEVHRSARGRGLGREAVARIEARLKAEGVRAIVLQAGQLDPVAHGNSVGFWTKMGYEEWPGNYGIYDDRVMIKVLR